MSDQEQEIIPQNDSIHSIESDGQEESFNLAVSKEYNDEELKHVAEFMSPKVTSLLDTNEAALDDLLSSNQMAWMEEEEKFGYAGNISSDEDDDIHSEIDRLADAEQLLRDELEMSGMGFHSFVEYMENDDSGARTKRSDAITTTQKNHGVNTSLYSIDDHDDIYGSEEEEEDLDKDYDDNLEDDPKKKDSVDHDDLNHIEPPPDAIRSNTENVVQPSSSVSSREDNTVENKNRHLQSSSPDTKMKAYTLYDHAEFIGLSYDNSDLGYPSCPLLTKQDVETILDIPTFRHDLHNYTDTDPSESDELGSDIDASEHSEKHHDDEILEKKSKFRENAITELLNCTREFVKPMTSEALCRIYAGLEDGKHIYNRSRRKSNEKKDLDEKQHDRLLAITIQNPDGTLIGSQHSEITPVRTVAIQIRPDVLVGATMDAIYTAIVSASGEVTKRQGGHIRALLPGRWIHEHDYVPFRQNIEASTLSNIFGSPMPQPSLDSSNGMVFVPPFVIDAQLCTKKRSRYAERILLIRIYSIREGQILDEGSAVCAPNPPYKANRMTSDSTAEASEARRPNNILRESAALFQRMRQIATVGGKISFDVGDILEHHDIPSSPSHESQKKSGGVRGLFASPLKLFSPNQKRPVDPQTPQRQSPRRRKQQQPHHITFDTNEKALIGKKAARIIASENILSSFTETPSALDEVYDVDPISALSHVDWPFIFSSWGFLLDCLNELDNRDLAYSTLSSCLFGEFPSLPTLDVHHCSQMKELCKENMVSSLLKSAHELESYAKEAETQCAKLKQVLEPMILSYEEESPELPETVPLTAYPLDYVAPEVSSPPWGREVVEALNIIAAEKTSIGNIEQEMNAVQIKDKYIEENVINEFKRTKDAVSRVLTAFQKQYDEELSARLGRKNCQVMDRLAKMQAFRRELIVTIRGSFGINSLATKAAQRFHDYAKDFLKTSSKRNNNSTPLKMTILPASDQVPLLSCRAIVGGSAGMCYVTYNELLLVTQSVPLFGGNHLSLVLLKDVQIELKKGKKSRLNPVPSMLIVTRKLDGQQLFSFRPSTGAHLFKDFIDVVKVVSEESPEALSFSSTGGMLKMFEQQEHVAQVALGRQ